MVIHDNVHIRAFTKMLLENAGYFMVSAADGEEGPRFYGPSPVEPHQQGRVHPFRP